MTLDVTKGVVVCSNGHSDDTKIWLGGTRFSGINGFDLTCSVREMQKLSCSFIGKDIGRSKIDSDLSLDLLKEKYEFVYINSNGVGATANIFCKGQKILNAVSVEIHVKAPNPISIKVCMYEKENEVIPRFGVIDGPSYVIVERVEMPTHKLGSYMPIG